MEHAAHRGFIDGVSREPAAEAAGAGMLDEPLGHR